MAEYRQRKEICSLSSPKDENQAKNEVEFSFECSSSKEQYSKEEQTANQKVNSIKQEDETVLKIKIEDNKLKLEEFLSDQVNSLNNNEPAGVETDCDMPNNSEVFFFRI